MKRILTLLAGIAAAMLMQAQVYTFESDDSQIGYYNRPYQRYEAEPEYCSTNGEFLAASDNQADLQSEASHQQALQLTTTGSYVSWTIDRPGDGLTIRFSLPDNAQGTGIEGSLKVYAGEEEVGDIYLSSYWAWQYTTNGGNYPVNTPATPGNGNVVRMRFDENHVRLSRTVASGEVLKLVKTDINETPYTVDFIELEPVPAKVEYSQVQAEAAAKGKEAVAFDPQNGNIADFIKANQGKMIYIPEGTHATDKRIYLRSADGTEIIGAGMWYSQIWFSAPSDNASTYSLRGFECDKSNLRIEGLYLNTINNQRYYNNDNSKQVGKGFMGTWGKNSVIRSCWVEHFECGAWIANYSGIPSENLLVEHCRFRNNYADGINCAQKTKGHTIRYCSFRNNGDDDMASWSTVSKSEQIEYAYCTAENNWRASSLGFFGGTAMRAHHIYIADALECGARINADFSGPGFGATDSIYLHHILIEHSGCVSGNRGNRGDFWGNVQGALNVGGTNYYNVSNVVLDSIEIRNSRSYGLYLVGGKNSVEGLKVRNLAIDGATYGICFLSSLKGEGKYCNITIQNVTNKESNTCPSKFTWTESCDGEKPEGLTKKETTVPSAGKVVSLDGEVCIFRAGKQYSLIGIER